MNQQINLATRDGISSVELFATFDSDIAGETFTFAIHRHLSCTTHVKVSELHTGMGVAEIPLEGLVATESPIFVGSELALQGQSALEQLISNRGAQSVANVLIHNRLVAQVLNEQRQMH
ncbi:MAG: hypothetical protein ACNJA3_27670 (plasmid) [Pseudomonas rhizophila]|uniref:hypothetical protein n=1 Tax=Pseudomonas rhizophila TaxID=2045200 RepID=UPI003F6BD655